MASTWHLTAAQRDDVVQRVVNSICALCHANGVEVTAETALVASTAIEKKAYTAAEVAARTTTGSRPLSETTTGYARKLGELVLEVVRNKGRLEGADAAAAAAAQGAEHLDLTGGRDFLTAEAAEAALAPMLASGSTIKKVKLSTKSFGRDAAGVAARAFANVAAILEEADISDVIAGRPEDEALDALRAMAAALARAPALTALNLSDNALGEKGVRAAAAVLTERQASLESLSLQNVGLSIHACRAVAELLPGAALALRRLQLFNNMSGDEGAVHVAGLLARAPGMQDLRFASSRVGPEGGIALARGLMAGSALVKLDISDNPLTEEVVPALCGLIKSQPALRVLNLNDTGLGSKGAAQVCVALAQAAPQLEDLGLALNEIDGQGAKAVAALLLAKAALGAPLARLSLRENELGDRGAAVLARGLAAVAALRAVDLVGNQIKRAGAVAVAKALCGRQGASLELLALDENCISSDGLDELRGVLEGAGLADALGPLDENMSEDDDEGDEEDEEGGDDYGLSELLGKAAI